MYTFDGFKQEETLFLVPVGQWQRYLKVGNGRHLNETRKKGKGLHLFFLLGPAVMKSSNEDASVQEVYIPKIK